jgi:spore coat protein U-like protein
MARLPIPHPLHGATLRRGAGSVLRPSEGDSAVRLIADLPATASGTVPIGRHRPAVRLGLVLAVVGIAATPASSTTGTTNVAVNATLVGGCTAIVAPTIGFGNVGSIGPLASPVEAQGSFNVTCTNGLAYAVYLGLGANSQASPFLRRMASGSALLPYQLYKDSGRSAVWGDSSQGASFGTSASGTGTAQPYTIYGRIAAGTVLPSTLGSYSDTVTITVSY